MNHRLALLALSALAAVLEARAQPAATVRDRLRAVRELAKQSFEAIPEIAAYATDAAVEVRLETVKRLNEIGGPRTLGPLLTLAADADPEVQLHALDGLINIFVPGYLKSGVARTASRAKDGSLRVKFNEPGDLIVEGYVKVDPDAIRAAASALATSPNLAVRANAARALGIFRASSAIPELTQALYSKDDQLMYESLVALEKIRDTSAGPGLAFLIRDLNERIRIAAIRAAGILRARQAAPGIRTVIEDNPNPRVLRAAFESLAMIADPADRSLFQRTLSHRDPNLRAAAAEGLARIQDPSDAELLETLFHAEREMAPRLSMAFALVALGRLEIQEFSPFRYLITTLNRASYRNVALAFLVELARQPGPRQTIHLNLAQATKDEKIGLCRVLAESGEADSLPHLSGLKDDKDPEVAHVCLRSLRTLEARLK
jgi:HEAT repeat protein